MRAIGYFRADAIGQSSQEKKSLVDFEEDFHDFCDLNLHQPIRTFGDLNAGGDGRYPQYDNLVSFINQPGSSYLVAIPDASHLGSEIETVVRAFLEIEQTGCKVTCQDDEMPDPLQNALVVLGVTGVSRARSGKIKESMQNKALRGKGLGRPPFGYRNGEDGTLTIVEDEAAVVQLIFDLYTRDEMGLRLIVQHLNEREIPTRRGGRWNVVSIRDILRNPVYVGTYTRFGLRLPRAHEPIIDNDTFRAARDIIESRRPRQRRAIAEPYLLSGIVYCDFCGNRMMGVTRHQRWRNKDGNRNRSTYRYYQCQARNNQSVCGYHTWREADLEGSVLSQMPLAMQAKTLQRMNSNGGSNSVDDDLKKIWDERVKNAERRFLQALKKTASGREKTEHLEKALEELDKVRAGAASAENPPDVDEVLAKWGELPFDEKRDFLLTHIARIEVRDHMVRVVV